MKGPWFHGLVLVAYLLLGTGSLVLAGPPISGTPLGSSVAAEGFVAVSGESQDARPISSGSQVDVRKEENPSPPPPLSYTRAEDRDRSSAAIACPTYQNVPGLAVDVNNAPFIANVQLFLDTCPQNDPNLAQIQSDFYIRRDGALVNSFPCTEPVSKMPVAQYTDQLIYLQVLRVIYYMDRGQSGHLPWTTGTLYDWMKSRIGGVNIVTGVYGGYCCEAIGGRVYFVGGTHDDYNREFDKTWEGISNVMAFAAHERRHLDGDSFPHTSCCGISFGCDDNFNASNLAPYAVQWWLEKIWLEGTINVGVGCLSGDLISKDAQWHLSNANSQFRSRFCNTKPPLLTLPAAPGGPCSPRRCPCQALTIAPATLPGAIVGSAYVGTLTTSGGTAPYTYLVTGGSPPTGLNLSLGGIVSGTTSVVGTFTFTVKATDAAGCDASRSYTMSAVRTHHLVRRHFRRI